MSRIRALIVDDEPLARDAIRLRLDRHADVDVVGSVGRADDAAPAIDRLTPDVVFLDVQMPGMTGFDVVARLEHEPPAIVFVTAYDQFALQAFRAHALDYLLKPIDDDRFLEVLTRVRHQIANARDGASARRLRSLLSDAGVAPRPAPTGEEYLERLPLKEKGRIILISVAEIDRIEADGDHVRVHAGARSHVVREKLGELERRLDPARFARIHRSTIVNLQRIHELQPYLHGEYILVTSGGARLKVSRSYRDRLKRALGNLK